MERRRGGRENWRDSRSRSSQAGRNMNYGHGSRSVGLYALGRGGVGERGQGRGTRGRRGGSAEGNRNPPPREERTQTIGFLRLQEFSLKEGQDLLQTITNKNSGIPWLLEQQNIKPDWVVLLLSILGRSCMVENNPATQITLLARLKESIFFKQHMMAHLTTMMTRASRLQAHQYKTCIKHTLTILKTLLHRMPSSVSDMVPISTTLELVLRTLRSSNILVDDDLDRDQAEVQQMRDHVLASGAARQKDPVMDEEEGEPPDDFRQLTIYPSVNDIYSEEPPFLRANRVFGQYTDLNHYLDVQFRLLREDFLGPLRDGVTEYLNFRNDAGHRFQDIRLYLDVHLLNPVCSSTGIAYRIRFDASRFPRVRWESTRRLIFGSLVCLSLNNFQTMFFATVANRSPKSLKDGELEVMFQENHRQIREITPNQSFVMAETSAYFEAYRHVLSGLQQIEDTFPFQRYIIQCHSEAASPRYLTVQHHPRYDLRVVVDENCNTIPDAQRRRQRIAQLLHGRNDSDSDEDLDDIPEVADLRVSSTSAGAQSLSCVDVLDHRSWPDAETFKLDSSQREALIAALTKELVLIQGPPGTGKTFLGLKIVKALIHNRSTWQTNRMGEERPSPILVVCYTNHALDQFLEGIAQFLREGIVRVGGRCQSERLDSYKLANLRQGFREKRQVPRHIRDGRFDSKADMDRCKCVMETNISYIQATEKGLLHEDTLTQYMAQGVSESLSMEYLSSTGFQFEPVRRSTVFYEWLGLDGGRFATRDAAGAFAVVDAANGHEVNPHEDLEDIDEDEWIEVEDENDRLQEQRMEDDNRRPDRKEQRRREEIQEAANVQLAVRLNDITDQASEEGWQTVGPGKGKGKNKTKKWVKKELLRQDKMSDQEANNVMNVWRLSYKDRWRLYRHWVGKYCDKLRGEIRTYEGQYQQAAERHREMLEDEDMVIMQNAKVVGMTTTCAARYRRALQQIAPKIIVVEEAAEVLEAHIVTTLSPGCNHLILIGDHQQLRPNPNVYKLAQKYNLKYSLFERLIMNNVPCVALEKQHRMRPQISEIMLHIYPGLRDDESVMAYEDIKGVSRNVFFVTHSEPEASDNELKSKANTHEACYVVALCQYLLLQGYAREQITILTPYTGQLLKIKHQMPKAKFEGVRVTAIDNFQGEENDIVILSLVRSNNEGNIGFMKEDNRACVALSRAKKGFFVIGNFEVIGKASDLWSKIVQTMKQNGNIGPDLPLYCQNHPATGIQARTAKDFNKAPEGGCQVPCGTRLNCGHVCMMVCHVYDRDHKDYKCLKTCNKILCKENHRCRRPCWKDCGECMTPVEKIIPICFHKEMVPCSVRPSKHVCQKDCSTILSCGHKCQARCGEPHTQRCMEVIKKLLPCGHLVDVVCHEKVVVCTVKCDVGLECSHSCSGTCSKCFEGRLHQPCRNPRCGRTLICGHTCKEQCSLSCPSCKAQCENRCVHSRCTQPCGKPCKSCMEQCQWKCRHFACTKLCHEPCDRPRCNEPCTELLICGHPCIGLCGEPCPKKCRVCDKEEVQEIFLGDEEEPNARFVQLEDCGHVIEVGGLDMWMDSSVESSDGRLDVQMRACPKCKTPVRCNLRYGAIIKANLADIEKVKKRIFGESRRIEMMKANVRKEIRYLKPEDREEIEKRLASDYLQMEEAYALANSVAFLKTLWKTEAMLNEKRRTISIDEQDKEIRKTLKIIQKLREWIFSRHRYSDQMLDQCKAEVDRIRLKNQVLLLRMTATKQGKAHNVEVRAVLRQCDVLMDTLKPFSERDVHSLREKIKKLEALLPSSGLCISDEERIDILKAMGLSKGHWFKCPKGHIYAIGDCGGAMVEANCPECGSTIGGHSHNLRRDNALAPEMDNAAHAAWSEAANLANFDIDELDRELGGLNI